MGYEWPVAAAALKASFENTETAIEYLLSIGVNYAREDGLARDMGNY